MPRGTNLVTKASCQAWLKLLIANEVRIGGLGGSRAERDKFGANHHLILVATVVVFAAHVPGGNWVTVGFDSPLVQGRRAMEELENIGVGLGKAV